MVDKKSLRLLIIGIVSIILLVVFYRFSSNISLGDTGNSYDYECLIKSFIVVLISIIVIRIMFAAIINPSEIRRNKKMPSILKYILGTLVLIAAAVYIVTAIYSQSAMAIFTTLGASGIGIAWVSQDILKEVIAGIIISFQNDFRVGDWVKFPDGTVARIVRTKLTGVDLVLLNDTRLYVSNTAITNQAMINLSQTDPAFFNRIEVVLEHDVPIEQARRILYTATANTPGLASKQPLIVADAVQQNGISFVVFFKIPSFAVGAEMKHRVISSVVQHLHKHGLKVCEISGQINVQNIDTKIVRTFDDNKVTDEISTLRFSGLLKDCGDEIQTHFAKSMEKLLFKSGEVICNQGETGDTMFIIAEGVVEVSLNVSVTEKDGKVKSSSNVIAILSDGDYFGEMALLRGERRNATVTAKSDVVLYQIKRETIKAFLNQYPDFARKLSTAIITRNSENESKKSEFIRELSKKEDQISEFMNAFKLFLGA